MHFEIVGDIVEIQVIAVGVEFAIVHGWVSGMATLDRGSSKGVANVRVPDCMSGYQKTRLAPGCDS